MQNINLEELSNLSVGRLSASSCSFISVQNVITSIILNFVVERRLKQIKNQEEKEKGGCG